jgi:hypothetical protein
MLGWHISVFRQADGGAMPAASGSAKGGRVAVWQTGLGGLKWIDVLVGEGRVVDLGGNGYPCWYTAQVRHLVQRIVDGPPEALNPWVYGPDDVLTEAWEGRTVIDRAAADHCRPDEWLLVEVWDES